MLRHFLFHAKVLDGIQDAIHRDFNSIGSRRPSGFGSECKVDVARAIGGKLAFIDQTIGCDRRANVDDEPGRFEFGIRGCVLRSHDGVECRTGCEDDGWVRWLFSGSCHILRQDHFVTET